MVVEDVGAVDGLAVTGGAVHAVDAHAVANHVERVDYDKFTIHPGIMGPLTVFEITPDGKGGTKIRERDEDLVFFGPALAG